MQLVAGWLVDRFDVKYVFAAGFALWSAATAVTGLLHGLAALIAVRVVLGAGESVAFPAYSKVVPSLYPEERRAFANAWIGIGQSLGPAFGLLFGGVLMARFGWRPFFLATGLASLLWLLPWLRWMPRADPATLTSTPTYSGATGPGWRELLSCWQLWAVSICLFCTNYGLYFMLTWMPYYLIKERRFTTIEMAQIAAAYFLAAAVAAPVCGRFSDRMIRAGRTPTSVRKAFMIASLVGGGTLMMALVLMPRAWLMSVMLLAGVAFGLGSANLWVISQRLAGREAIGRWCGVQLFLANLSGVLGSALTGYLVQGTGHFFWPFAVLAAVMWIGGLSWMFLVGPVEPIQWKLSR
jgi:MFS family permease